MDNPEKLATKGTQYKEKHNTPLVLKTAIHK